MDNDHKFNMQFRVILQLIFGAVVILGFVYSGLLSKKVTDPSDARFDPVQFKFEDYEIPNFYEDKESYYVAIEQLSAALESICSISDVSIDIIDSILLHSAGAKKASIEKNYEGTNMLVYSYWKYPHSFYVITSLQKEIVSCVAAIDNMPVQPNFFQAKKILDKESEFDLEDDSLFDGINNETK